MTGLRFAGVRRVCVDQRRRERKCDIARKGARVIFREGADAMPA
jgi:hypothetical protein